MQNQRFTNREDISALREITDNKDKQYTIPQRAIIGKVSPDNENLMFPNEKFQEYFPDAEIPEELPEEYRSCSLRIGSYAVIRKVLKEYSLPGMLAKWFGENAGIAVRPYIFDYFSCLQLIITLQYSSFLSFITCSPASNCSKEYRCVINKVGLILLALNFSRT